MKWSHVYLFLLGLAASIARYLLDPFPDGSQNPVIALMALNTPALLWLTHAWYAVMPGVVSVIAVALTVGVSRVWFDAGTGSSYGKGSLPPWPISDTDPKPAIVVGETHHPIEAREVSNPNWLVIPGARLVYRRRDFRRGRIGKNVGVYEPFRAPAFILAGRRSRAPGGRADPGG